MDFMKFVKSPKTLAYLKLGIAVIGVVHAIDELMKAKRDQSRLTE